MRLDSKACFLCILHWLAVSIVSATAMVSARYSLEQAAWASSSMKAPSPTAEALVAYSTFRKRSNCGAAMAAFASMVAVAVKFKFEARNYKGVLRSFASSMTQVALICLLLWAVMIGAPSVTEELLVIPSRCCAHR